MRLRSPWTTAAALGLLAAVLAIATRRAPVAHVPPSLPLPSEPAAWVLVAGRFDGSRVERRAVLAFPDGLDVVLQEGSHFRAKRQGGELVFHLDAGRLYVDGGGLLRVVTPVMTATGNGAVFNVHLDERGASVTALHGQVVVAGSPFRKEISRGESLDVTPTGAVREPLMLDPAAVVEWARGALEAADLLRDGGFEEEFRRWEAPQYPETAVRIDRRAHGGRRSALVVFNAVRDYRHASPRSSPFSAAPGARLRMRAYVEHGSLEAGPGGGAWLEIRDGDGAAVPGSRTVLLEGASGWRKVWVEFEAPVGLRDARVVCTKADNGAPIQGTLRLDDVAVYLLPPAAKQPD